MALSYSNAEHSVIWDDSQRMSIPCVVGNSQFDEIEEAGTAIADYAPPAVPMGQVRADRDALLAACDWVVTKALEAGTAVPSAWVTYRTSLRDFPAAVDLDNIVWPTAP
tara:strand:+ start:391 stop:717 length:327 start_codon:yes stop_codon:yes gene_type:complete